jgi:hypothetical protein
MNERSVSKMKWHSWGLILFIGLTLYFHFFTEDRWFPLLDSANLAFHEAGHLFLGILSDRLNVYGGTLLQLAIPIYIYYRFRSDHQFLASSWALVWLAENLLNVARYLGDAQVQILPLVGGGMHDWTEILSRWHLLSYDQWIAGLIQLIALGLMLKILWRFNYLVVRYFH